MHREGQRSPMEILGRFIRRVEPKGQWSEPGENRGIYVLGNSMNKSPVAWCMQENIACTVCLQVTGDRLEKLIEERLSLRSHQATTFHSSSLNHFLGVSSLCLTTTLSDIQFLIAMATSPHQLDASAPTPTKTLCLPPFSVLKGENNLCCYNNGYLCLASYIMLQTLIG